MNYPSLKKNGNGPLYLQLVDWVIEEISAGNLRPGDRLNSVREISEKHGTNPNTVQRALTLLEEQGVIYTRTTAGKFVSQDAAFIGALRERVARKRTAEFVEAVRRLHLTDDEILESVTSALRAV